MSYSPLTPEQLLSSDTMLETLRMAYLFVLDEVEMPNGSHLLPDDISRRLDVAGQRELVRRLGQYAVLRAEIKETHKALSPEVDRTLDALGL